MASKYRYLSRALKQDGKWGRAFKWQWAVLYDYQVDPGVWKPSISTCDSRLRARVIKRSCQRDHKCRNVRLARRLVQVEWQAYNDTYSYSAKGNGNGR